jgi:hypothetical protein
MPKKTFSRDYLKNERDLPWNALYDEMVDQGRWTTTHRCIFEDDGKFYEAYYREGSTENCDERPWEYDNEVECTEVALKEVTVKKWLPAD